MNHYKKILSYVSPYWKQIILGLIVKFIGTLLTLFSFLMIIPFFEVLFFDQSLVENSVPFTLTVESFKTNFYYLLSRIIQLHGNETALIAIGIFVAVMVSLQSFCRYYVSYTMSRVSQIVGRDIREELFQKIIYLPLAFFSNVKKGDILSRFGIDINKFQTFIISSIFTILTTLVSFAVYLFAVFYIHIKLSLLILGLSIPAIYVVNRIGKRLREMAKTGMELLGSNMSFIDGIVYGIKIVKTFNAEKNTISGFERINDRLTRLMIRLGRRNAIINPATSFMGMIALVIIMLLGGVLILNGNTLMSSQAFVSYLVVLYQLIKPVKSLSNIYYNIEQGMASYERIDELMKLQNSVSISAGILKVETINKTIEYKNVSFQYETSRVLKNINVTVEKGQTIALVGRSGAGKSTFADLLPRFYDINEGEILIDGIPIRHFEIHSLRGLIGMVSQEPILFHTTICDNISFSKPDAVRDAVIRAATIANAHDFIMDLEKGYDTVIGERGIKLSGGEQKRITIARAVLSNPPVLILDEATSELDSESEELVQEALYKLMKNRTTIVIAHRLSTIRNADCILVFDRGEIKERGSFDELMKNEGIFKALHEKQYGVKD